MHQFTWRPGIGDPTIGGWVTVVLYFSAVWSVWKTAHSAISSERQLWRAISILFIGLGINKQLDLQTAFTELGRMVAFDQGWYGERRTVQLWFIAGVALTASLLLSSCSSGSENLQYRPVGSHRNDHCLGLCSDLEPLRFTTLTDLLAIEFWDLSGIGLSK